jgi:flagellar hook assembly protein FlgD
VEEEKAPGNYKIIWDGKDNSGNEVSSGIYFYQLKTAEYISSKKMVLLK